MTCNCGSSRFLYAPAGHVITGNLFKKDLLFKNRIILTGNLIENFILRQLRNTYNNSWPRKETFIFMSMINGNIRTSMYCLESY